MIKAESPILRPQFDELHRSLGLWGVEHLTINRNRNKNTPETLASSKDWSSEANIWAPFCRSLA